MIERIAALLSRGGGANAVLPATDLYNEGWMLRLAIDWFDQNRSTSFDLQFEPDARWYSEALLPSAFLARERGDKLAESWTHADGVIGHFEIGSNGAGDLVVAPTATQLIVTEAKMFSKLSPGVKKASYFNQAARNVACMAEVVKRANKSPYEFDRLGFLLIAPKSRIDEGVFAEHVELASIKKTVERRVSEYHDEAKRKWYEAWFLPVLESANIGCISWESIIGVIRTADPEMANDLERFYESYLQHNAWVKRRYT